MKDTLELKQTRILGLTRVDFLVGVFILGVLVAILMAPFVKFSSVGRGLHTGYVTALEKEGYFFPNYRVYFKTDNSSSQEDTYCLHRDREYLAILARDVSKKRQLVNIEFKGVRGIGLGLCDDIEILNITIDKK